MACVNLRRLAAVQWAHSVALSEQARTRVYVLVPAGTLQASCLRVIAVCVCVCVCTIALHEHGDDDDNT